MRRIPFTSFVMYLFAALVLGFAALPANAQDNASVTGVVTDPSGAVVPHASVTLVNPSIGFSMTKTTNTSGVYEFSNVPPASNYSLVFSMSGFSSLTLGKFTLNVGTKETRDVQLHIGDARVSIEVTASASETLNTTDATIGSNIDGDRIQELPNVLYNNAANYLVLAPGVVPYDGAVTGTRSDQTNITLDGLDVNDQRGGFSFYTTVNTPLDSIQEMKVTSTGDDATYGHSAGGQMELVTKGGTNAFHGQLFEYNRTTDYTANDYFNNLQGIPNPQLIRNQFGGDLGGPILKKKLFFFFSYNGLRQVAPEQNLLTVPMPSFYNGQLAYYNVPNPTPTTLPVLSPLTGPNSLAGLDPCVSSGTCPPQGPGADQSLMSFLQGRGYAGTAALPAPNNNSVGDGLNTSGYYFVSPARNAENTFVGRLDYQATTNHRLFVRGTWDKTLDGGWGGQNVQVFPTDPNPSAVFVDHSRAWVVGETWTISPTMTNQASFGETNQVNAFVVTNKPTFPNSLSFFDSYYGYVIGNPYIGLNEQFPVVPVYQGRDTFTWLRGKHTLQFGGVISPVIFKSGNLTDTSSYALGIGGFISGLTSTDRPSDFNGDSSEWDRVFALALGRYSNISSGYNYDLAGNPLPQGGVPIRDYHSTQYEAFAQDSWKVRSDFTVTYGVRWQFHKPLTEVNGFEAIQNQTPQSIFSVRLQDAAQGISGPDAVPFITYSLGGSANHAPGYYKPSYDNFGPRLGLAYSPGASEGWLGRLFGNRKTSIRAGFGLDFDNNLIGQGFELDESSFLFSNSGVTNYGDLATDPRFSCPSPCTGTSLSASLPAPAAAPAAPRPTLTPNLDANGFPIGFFNGGFGQGAFFNFDPNYKTPYEMHFSLGVQRELPGGWLVEADYVGKLGRRLPALGDPAQTLNFKDATSGQTLYSAFGAVEKQVQANTPVTSITAQPWFENQMGAALAPIGLNCATIGPVLAPYVGPTNNCTQLADALAGYYFGDGDTSSLILSLADTHLTGNVEQGLLLPNVALLAQDGAAGFIGNYSSSSYNALLVRVNHRLSHNLTMELNYTYSHSIDNDSGVQNNLITFSTSEICDLRNLRVCRSSSDFDHRHLLSSSFEYGLPFGQGKWIANGSSKLLDELIGGWRVSGIFSAFTGSPFKIDSGAYTIDFTQTQPAVFIGTKSDIKAGIHTVSQGSGLPPTVQYFSNVTNAQGAFTAPIAGGPGNRNIVTGPGYWDLDLALLKDFKMPWEGHKLVFQTDAINVFNHVNFSNPGASLLVPYTFGNITSDVNGPRILQLGLRYIF
ncbi:MAG: carboxypeptidase-like regulatory domain-containing protein [Terriglobales bacterium]